MVPTGSWPKRLPHKGFIAGFHHQLLFRSLDGHSEMTWTDCSHLMFPQNCRASLCRVKAELLVYGGRVGEEKSIHFGTSMLLPLGDFFWLFFWEPTMQCSERVYVIYQTIHKSSTLPKTQWCGSSNGLAVKHDVSQRLTNECNNQGVSISNVRVWNIYLPLSLSSIQSVRFTSIYLRKVTYN